MARRLLVVGGIALAGWLLGSAGQAHAETGPDSAADLARAVVNTVPDRNAVPDGTGPELGLPGGVLRDGTATARPAERAAHRAARAAGARRGMFGGLVRGVVAPIREHRFFILPDKIEQVMTGVIPTMGGTAKDAPWPPQHRIDSAAGDGARAAVNIVVPGNTSGAAEEVRSGPAQFRNGTADPAPQPGSPHRAVCQTGALSSAGSVLTGGAVGHPARFGAAARPATVLASVLDAIPPAVHTATDEPALSPD